jgi:hypothetical protein
MRLTWVITGGLVVLLVLAGVDALRSRDSETPVSATESTTSASTTLSSVDVALPRCEPEQIRVSLEILGGYATVVVGNEGANACRLRPLPLEVRIRDRTGQAFSFDRSAQEALLGGNYPPGEERTSELGQSSDCRLHDPILIAVSVGPFTARRRNLTSSEVGCLQAAGLSAKREIERIGNAWAPLFAAGPLAAACRHETQPLCERIACQRVGGFEMRNCTPPTSAFRNSFFGATVQAVEIRGQRAAARFSNGEVVELYGDGGTWSIHRLGRNAGHEFFE